MFIRNPPRRKTGRALRPDPYTPVECGRSRETAKRSELAGWGEYGYCASHSRYFGGLRLHLLCTPHGLPITFALTGAKADERETLLGMLADPSLAIGERELTIMGDKNYFGTDFEATLTEAGITLLRPARNGERPRPGKRYLKPLRQIIESINDTFKGQLDLEAHGARTPQRRHRPHHAAHPCPHRHDLAQLPHPAPPSNDH